MELMVVVSVIAITAALAAPALSLAMAQRRAREATHSLVRIGARARAEAMAYGRAHLLVYTDASDGGARGRLELWRGRVNTCSYNDWVTLLGAACATSPDCLEDLDMGSFAGVSHAVEMRLPGASTGWLCFQANGDMRFAPGGGLFTENPPAGTGGVRFTLQRLVSGVADGVTRAVVFPFGGSPRIVR